MWIASHADEAVGAFFVLSGFVITFVLMEKEKTYQAYIYARFSRIFSVVLVALVATYVIDKIGRHYDAVSYDTIPFYDDHYLASLVRALTFTNEFWTSHSVFGSNEAYWSLGFEIPYYVAAGLFVFLPGRLGLLATVLFLVLAGPKIALYFPLWLLGVATFKVASSKMFNLSSTAAVACFVASLVLYVLVKLLFADYKLPMNTTVGLQEGLQSLAYYFGISLAVAMSIFAVSRLDRSIDISFAFVTPYLQWMAGGSFTLYLVHQPLLTALRAIYPNIALSPVAGYLGVVGIVAICYALAEIGERRKRWYGQLGLQLIRPIERRIGSSSAH
ncbi:hypothetical protein ASG43_21865 [Aureimonas sp. Leaf454]|nr:hypothetical protein ASG43_21865 [Aureimonas sp. Leaf454]